MSTFGRLFRVTTCGESHSAGIAVIVDGCPPGIPLDAARDIAPFLRRRRPGQSAITTPRAEADAPELLCGTEGGVTLGTPIGIVVRNADTRPSDYAFMGGGAGGGQTNGGTTTSGGADGTSVAAAAPFVPRPSHADYTTLQKYAGFAASSGGGRSSARETVARVAAGAVAEAVLARVAPRISIVAHASRIGPVVVDVAAVPPNLPAPECAERVGRAAVDAFVTRMPDKAADAAAQALLADLQRRGDSIGGVVACTISGLSPGLGEPCFDKLEALLAHAMMSIPASKGFEFGSGFGCAEMLGSVHNDAFVAVAEASGPPEERKRRGESAGRCARRRRREASDDGSDDDASGDADVSGDDGDARSRSPFAVPLLATRTNNSGGVQGGISNGADVTFRVAFKPPATIALPQATCDVAGAPQTLRGKGRHDPCVVPRAVPIVEAMAALVVLDCVLLQQQRSRTGLRGLPIRRR